MTMIIDSDDSRWDMHREGPIIIFRTPCWEVFVTLQISWRQDGCSTGVLTRWDIDSDACCERHLNLDWNGYWRAFLDLIPDECVADVMRQELTMKY